MLEVYGHGGDLETASLRYGIAPNGFTDFSANINPLGSPPGLLDRLTEALPDIVRYPDPGHRLLTSLLAQRNQVQEVSIVIGNGAAENMALALLAISPKMVGIVEPCFSEYATLSRQMGAEVRSIFGTEERSFKAAAQDVERLIAGSDLVFIGQPNNPNGVQYGLDELRFFADAGERHKTYVVLDEAFIDFIPASERQSLLPELERYKYVILIRSMTKFYAIPGLRLGYAIANPPLVAAMTDKQVSWSVNLLALIAGEYCLAAGEEYEAKTIALVKEQRDFLRKGLNRLGCTTWPGEANFLLVRLPIGWTAAGMQEVLGRQGILVRNCAMYPGLSDRDIRVAVKNSEDNRKLLTEMEHVIGGTVS